MPAPKKCCGSQDRDAFVGDAFEQIVITPDDGVGWLRHRKRPELVVIRITRDAGRGQGASVPERNFKQLRQERVPGLRFSSNGELRAPFCLGY